MPLSREQLQVARKKISKIGLENTIPISSGRMKMLDNLLDALGEGNKYKEGDPISKDDLDEISNVVNGVLDVTTNNIIKQLNEGKRETVYPEYFMMTVADHLYLRCIDKLGYPTIPAGFDDSVIEKYESDIQAGIVSEILRVDGVHYNSVGYALLGNRIFRQMVELGYFDPIFDYYDLLAEEQ